VPGVKVEAPLITELPIVGELPPLPEAPAKAGMPPKGEVPGVEAPAKSEGPHGEVPAKFEEPAQSEPPTEHAHSRHTAPAAFVWFPTSPRVTLVSSATDFTSPITAYGWDLSDSGVFADGGVVIRTAFSSPASPVVRMRVTDANGLSSIAASTIHMRPPRTT